jgi:NTE family protein
LRHLARVLLVLAGFSLALSGASAATPAGAAPTGARPKIGLVLSGGGALGATHIGVLKVLEEMHIPIDVIAGTSMGSIVGGLYAMGLSASELEQLVATIDWAHAMTDRPPRYDRTFRSKTEDYGFLLDLKLGIKDGDIQLPPSLMQGQKLTLMLRALTLRARNVTHFDQLPIRFRAVAADLETGRAVVLDRGSLASAMRASMSVPGVFPPVDIGGRLLVDGGVANNLPVDVARAMGAEVLIVVDIPSILKTRDQLKSSIDVAGQMLTVLIQQNSLTQMASMGPRDILIQPDLGHMGASDFDRIMDAVKPGEVAARKVAGRLQALSAPPADYTADKVARGRETVETPTIAFIDVINKTKLSDRRIRNLIHQKVGQPLDVATVEHDFTRLYGLGDFEQIDYALVERDGTTGMVVTAKEKTWAKDYVRAGLALEHDLNGDSSYSVGGGLTLTALNAYGAEWRNSLAFGSDQRLSSEFYQPLQPEPGSFVSAAFHYRRNDVTVWNGGERAAEYRLTAGDTTFFIGHEIDTVGEFRLGYRYGLGRLNRHSGTTGPEDIHFHTGQAIAQFTVDTLDDLGFPSEGRFGSVNFAHSDRAIGADETYNRLQVTANQVISVDRNRFIVGVQGGTGIGGSLPLYDRFTTGGLFSVSGYARDSITTGKMAIGRLVYMRAMSETSPLAFDLPLYLGASLEGGLVDDGDSGNEFERRVMGASLFAGADTILGPLYLAYGHADGGRQSVYLYFGKMF